MQASRSTAAPTTAAPLRPLRRLVVRAAARHQQQQLEQQEPQRPGPLQHAAIGAAALLASAALLLAPSGQLAAYAADTSKVGTCLLQNCQAALANCLTDTICAENLICLQVCNGRPDETECQIKCGDKYADKAVETFTACAISEQKCVPQRVDEGLFPVPPDCSLDNTFDLSSFQGRWYITAGLNPLFDTFDCQEHFFASPEPGKVFAKINWRIPSTDPLTGDRDFIDRSVMQRFVQEDAATPAVLVNKDNEFLNYQDTWYVLASKPDEYVFIYYRGQNDAWVGYGGATVYTRDARLPAEAIPELQAAAERAGLDWSKFIVTDNSCPPHPPERTLPERLQVASVRRAAQVEYELGNDLRSFGRGFTVLERDLSRGLKGAKLAQEAKLGEAKLAPPPLLTEAERALEAEAERAGKMIRRFEMEAKMGPWINWIPQSWRPILMPMP